MLYPARRNSRRCNARWVATRRLRLSIGRGVRDGAQRERERAKGGTAPIANQLYRTARNLLIAEVAVARGIEPDAADAWIVQHTNADAPTAAGEGQAPDERATR